MTEELPPRRTLAGLVAACLVCVGAAAFLAPGAVGALLTDAAPPDDASNSPGLATGTEPAVGTEGAAGTASPATRRTSGEAVTSGANASTRYTYTVGEGVNETAVTVVESGHPGPTVVVVGGQHGNEPAGYRAAGRVENWEIERGTLVVVPEANPAAVENGMREVRGRDLNGQFPVGERPRTAQARTVWGVLERHDANVVVDLHSSRGIYGVDGGVGQAVFPTVTGPAVEHADAAVGRTNREFELRGNRSFRRGNVMGRSGVSLTRKVAGDMGKPAYLVETTKRDTDLETRVEWTTAITWELLRLHGLVEGERPGR
ncbi:succinylglutamate desuccinylase/aspartoacylase family protein [Halorarum salinum]|uniref:Succinylglutamate desuccinylase/aspartoacylase family protein n=1 Tax=Halorarum salinum TaxID=2743089 RepID=A0A7D5QHD0_9EURY|nr:succinylglutamate desuccinylase/aspartoacylase family protein [Halobaculum salinum]QLG62682.1 succinylglutamate desuccinylase/aspartoacylase family protein [Halobaculum salinum]